MKPATVAAFSLLNAEAVRQRSHRLLALGLDGKLQHFRIEPDRLDAAADLVIESTRGCYPTLDVPLHSRWRHFTVAGEDRWAKIERAADWRTSAARARAAFDLVIVSVLLDAGVDGRWRYLDAVTGKGFGRSEGLALASLEMFAAGALARLSDADLRRYFQVNRCNPLPAIAGRVTLLRRLGEVVATNPTVFARVDSPRPGGLFDYLIGVADGNRIALPRMLSELLRYLGPIWPSRIELAGVPLGDCWHHPALRTDDLTTGLVPLHKLSQWLAYSLIEPLQAAGFIVTDVDGLTGLAEYRNGGLLIDAGVLVLRDPAVADVAHDVGSTLVVEWRALTVALLDQLAEKVRQRLNMDSSTLPLVKILQGGTWTAGRKIAAALRSDGAPPLTIRSDGTVF